MRSTRKKHRSSARAAATKARRGGAGSSAAKGAVPSIELISTVAREWRTTVDVTRESIIMIGPDSKIVRANAATQDLFGRPFSELVGARADAVAAPLLGRTDPLRLARARRSGRAFRAEVRSSDKRWFSLAVDPIPADRGSWNGAVCRLRDVTEKKRADLRLRRSLRQVRDLAAHLQNEREEERSSIARQIHDRLGHDLAALKLDVAWLEREVGGSNARIDERIAAMTEILDRGMKTLRRISTELRPELLDHFGPAAAIEWLAEELRLRTGVRTRLDLHAADLDLSDPISTALFRIVQEALDNVARHAGATQVTLSLRREGSEVVIRIADDGSGFDPARVAGSSFGLLEMRERARSLGGDLEIESGPAKGTTVTAGLPVG